MLSNDFIEKSSVCRPDPRWEFFCISSASSEVISANFDLWYDTVARIECRIELPQELMHRVYEIKNLMVYSWFVYSFAATAFFSSLFLLEAFLKEQKFLPPKTTLGNLIKQDKAIPEELRDKLTALIKIRNNLAHGNAMLLPPTAILGHIQSVFDAIAAFQSTRLASARS
jgi:uncharacterized protein YutE (UPF0331/DUF86 family)